MNLYLHGFTDPHIFEYDTLTSQDRWNEYADVILANPSFMSPKGGIKPHNCFSVQSKRSEVLFVDNMAEHLTPQSRAGIIVPKGIISAEKYRELESCKVQAGDVLISLVGTYGKTMIVPEKHEPGIINPRLLKLTLHREKMLPSFFIHALLRNQ